MRTGRNRGLFWMAALGVAALAGCKERGPDPLAYAPAGVTVLARADLERHRALAGAPVSPGYVELFGREAVKTERVLRGLKFAPSLDIRSVTFAQEPDPKMPALANTLVIVDAKVALDRVASGLRDAASSEWQVEEFGEGETKGYLFTPLIASGHSQTPMYAVAREGLTLLATEPTLLVRALKARASGQSALRTPGYLRDKWRSLERQSPFRLVCDAGRPAAQSAAPILLGGGGGMRGAFGTAAMGKGGSAAGQITLEFDDEKDARETHQSLTAMTVMLRFDRRLRFLSKKLEVRLLQNNVQIDLTLDPEETEQLRQLWMSGTPLE